MTRSDEGFLRQVREGTLPPAAFGHEGHLRFAWLCLSREPLGEAVASVNSGIRRLAAAHGSPGRYHRTLTTAICAVVASRMALCPAPSFEAFLRQHPALRTDMRRLVGSWYSEERLADARARLTLIAPDRCGLEPAAPGADAAGGGGLR